MFDAKDFKGNLTDGNYLIRKWQLLKPGPEPWTPDLDPELGPWTRTLKNMGNSWIWKNY